MSRPAESTDRPGPRILRYPDVPVTTWRNGAGLTRELYVGPQPAASDSFDWRISIADITVDGPFSSLPGIDRTLLLLEGPGMTLTLDGENHEVRPRVPFEFSGDRTTTCRLHSGTTRDLNLMVRRGRAIASFGLTDVAGTSTVPGSDATTVIAVALDGHLAATAGSVLLLLEPLDSVRLDSAGAATAADATAGNVGAEPGPVPDLTLIGEGTVATIHLCASPTPQPWMMVR